MHARDTNEFGFGTTDGPAQSALTEGQDAETPGSARAAPGSPVDRRQSRGEAGLRIGTIAGRSPSGMGLNLGSLGIVDRTAIEPLPAGRR